MSSGESQSTANPLSFSEALDYAGELPLYVAVLWFALYVILRIVVWWRDTMRMKASD
ncbi:hypothetical protein [Haloarchaeobius sp. DFWS5]|uniref:hypothetical protein n=1 Tax=Haloarchaeobius sp. DFWS5 TaxID=3446114 RepID=UPI003EBCEF40